MLTGSIYGYTDSLIDSLKNRGYEVTIFDKIEFPKNNLSLLGKIIYKLHKNLKISFLKFFWNRLIINDIKKSTEILNEEYDIVFDFLCRTEPLLLEVLKEKYENAEFILYIWDDMKHQKNAKRIMGYFDKVFSYNPNDSIKNKVSYRPNFYCKEFEYKDENKLNDIFYVGDIRDSLRVDLVYAIQNLNKNLKNNILLHIPTSKIQRAKKKYKNFEKITDNLINYHLKMSEIAEFSKKSKCLLDITYKNQEGLGLRPFEAIGAKTKLITTNENIRNYDFYNENNIFVIEKDFSNISKIEEFILKPYLEYSEEIKKKYNVEAFIDDIFGKEIYD